MTTPRTIFIGDVHGCLDELKELLECAGYDPAGDRLVFLGDLVDKGPKSAEVVRFVRKLLERGDGVCIQGNHEEKYTRFRKRLASADGDPSRVKMRFPPTKRAIFDALDDRDLDWLAGLPVYSFEGAHLAVHAGVCARRHLERGDLDRKRYQDRLRRIRKVDGDGKMVSLDREAESPEARSWAKSYDGRFGTVLYGHDASREVHRTAHAIGLDTGCCFGHRLTGYIVSPGEPARIVQVAARAQYARWIWSPIETLYV